MLGFFLQIITKFQYFQHFLFKESEKEAKQNIHLKQYPYVLDIFLFFYWKKFFFHIIYPKYVFPFSPSLIFFPLPLPLGSNPFLYYKIPKMFLRDNKILKDKTKNNKKKQWKAKEHTRRLNNEPHSFLHSQIPYKALNWKPQFTRDLVQTSAVPVHAAQSLWVLMSFYPVHLEGLVFLLSPVHSGSYTLSVSSSLGHGFHFIAFNKAPTIFLSTHQFIGRGWKF